MTPGETAPNLSSKKAAQAREVPKLGGLRVGPRLATALYALLLGSAVFAFWGNQVPGAVPDALARIAPWLFLGFLLLFGAYRLVLVRARKYPAFKAFFQLAVGGAVFALMLPGSRPPERAEGDLAALLESADPSVRAAAAELVGRRKEARYGSALVKRLEDSSEAVRNKAHEALVRLNGQDLGKPEQPGAIEAWHERYPP